VEGVFNEALRAMGSAVDANRSEVDANRSVPAESLLDALHSPPQQEALRQCKALAAIGSFPLFSEALRCVCVCVCACVCVRGFSVACGYGRRVHARTWVRVMSSCLWGARGGPTQVHMHPDIHERLHTHVCMWDMCVYVCTQVCRLG
jgi:hypothetical protein